MQHQGRVCKFYAEFCVVFRLFFAPAAAVFPLSPAPWRTFYESPRAFVSSPSCGVHPTPLAIYRTDRLFYFTLYMKKMVTVVTRLQCSQIRPTTEFVCHHPVVERMVTGGDSEPNHPIISTHTPVFRLTSSTNLITSWIVASISSPETRTGSPAELTPSR